MASMASIYPADSTRREVHVEYIPQATEQPSLPKVLSGRDLTIFSLLTVVSLSSISNIQASGPNIVLYGLLVLLLFVVPRTVIISWLRKRFVGKETPYHWVASEKGRTTGFFAAFCIWWPGVLIVASAIEAQTELTSFFPRISLWGLSTLLEQGLLIVTILFIATVIACIPLRWLRYILTAIAIPYLSIFLLLGGIGIYWFISGHASGFTHPTQHLNNNTTAYSLAVMSLIGVPIPLFFSQELKGSNTTRSASLTRFLWSSSILVCSILFLGTLGVIAIVPSAQATLLTSPVIAMGIIFGPAATVQTAAILALGQVAIISTAILLYSRLLVLLAQEKRLPQLLTRTNRYGVPVFSISIQSLIASTFAILIFIIVPYLIAHIATPIKLVLHIEKNINVEIFYCIQISASMLLTCTSSLMFISTLTLLGKSRRKHDMSLRHRIFLVCISVMGLGISLISIWSVLMHTQLHDHFSDTTWTIMLVILIALSIVFGWSITALPRVQASLEEQRRLNEQEANLRTQLQESYEQQLVLLEEVNILYHQHAEAAVTDAITGLPNHRAVMSKIDDMLVECRQTQQSCAILFTDLDHFKRVNDTWGHRAGDAILREVGHRFRTTLRTQDLIGRYGGEEFAILLAETDIEEASQIAERLRVAVNAEPCLWQEDGQPPLPIPVTTSIGVAVYSLHGTTRELLITSADQAMYRAKKAGRNRVCIADLEKDTMEQQNPTSADRRISEAEAVQALAAAASAHDGGTHDHSQRMIQLAEETARHLGRSEDEVYLIRLAALLHDIGKIGIPDAILHKPGPLTSDEWAIMRSHPDIGRTILEQTGGILRLLSNIVVAHHERWDGTGYPAQLHGENIPLGARILSVVDSYDAMTSQRAYRKPRPVDDAKAELQRCAGSQFDPQVVNAFLAVLDEQKNLLVVETR